MQQSRILDGIWAGQKIRTTLQLPISFYTQVVRYITLAESHISLAAHNSICINKIINSTGTKRPNFQPSAKYGLSNNILDGDVPTRIYSKGTDRVVIPPYYLSILIIKRAYRLIVQQSNFTIHSNRRTNSSSDVIWFDAFFKKWSPSGVRIIMAWRSRRQSNQFMIRSS